MYILTVNRTFQPFKPTPKQSLRQPENLIWGAKLSKKKMKIELTKT
jgi:hypothetical protein